MFHHRKTPNQPDAGQPGVAFGETGVAGFCEFISCPFAVGFRRPVPDPGRSAK